MTLSTKHLLAGLILSVLFLYTSPQVTHAQVNTNDGFGIGIIMGEPTGISPKLWIGQNTALAGGIAWSFSGRESLHLHMDYAIHNFSLINVDQGALGLYYGIGARVLMKGDDSKLGIRFPLGMSYMIGSSPIEIFFEIVPIFNLLPDTDFTGNGGIGVRYYF